MTSPELDAPPRVGRPLQSPVEWKEVPRCGGRNPKAPLRERLAVSSATLPSDPIPSQAIPAMLRALFRRSGVHTWDDLWKLDLEDLAGLRGVGAGKVRLAREFMRRSFGIAVSVRGDLPFPGVVQDANPLSEGAGVTANPASQPLAFVPSLLERLLRRSGIDTAQDLLTTRVGEMSCRRGWGQRKLGLLVALQELYCSLSAGTVALDRPVRDLLPKPFAVGIPPDVTTVKSFLAADLQRDAAGTRRADLLALQRLLAARSRPTAATALPAPNVSAGPCEDMEWQDIPLRLPLRATTLLTSLGIRTVGQLRSMLASRTVIDPVTGERQDVLEQSNFGEQSLQRIDQELDRFVRLGSDGYRYGVSGPPRTPTELVQVLLRSLGSRGTAIVADRRLGKSLQEIGDALGITRERVRQLEAKHVGSLRRRYTTTARTLIRPLLDRLDNDLAVTEADAVALCGLEEVWQALLLLAAADRPVHRLAQARIGLLGADELSVLERQLRVAVRDDALVFESGKVRLRGLLQPLWERDADRRRLDLPTAIAEQGLSPSQLATLVGREWVKPGVRSQLTAAGVNGLRFADLRHWGMFADAAELAEAMPGAFDLLPDGRLRRPGKIHTRGDEIVAMLKAADGPLTLDAIMTRSHRRWHQPALVGRYLGKLHETVLVGRGLYTHVEHLGLRVHDVVAVSTWAARTLAGRREEMDASTLHELLRAERHLPAIADDLQLISIASKHPDVRRLANSRNLIHAVSFDQSRLMLSHTNPDIAAQWHPTRNTVPLATVRPASFKTRWWVCERGHEFPASPVYRTRGANACPVCRPR